MSVLGKKEDGTGDFADAALGSKFSETNTGGLSSNFCSGA